MVYLTREFAWPDHSREAIPLSRNAQLDQFYYDLRDGAAFN